MKRTAGILLPIFSLPSPYGIGCFSRSAYDFVDWLKAAGQTYWQILPLGPTSYGDSPYQSFSTFAGNPYFISLEALIEEGVLTKKECDAADLGDKKQDIAYQKLYKNRYPLLRRAYERSRVTENPAYLRFVEENRWWLSDYALFMAVKSRFDGAAWSEWAEDIRLRYGYAMDYYRRELYFDIEFHQYLQFKFFEQWTMLKDYANRQGIRIIGDIPIYVAMDSADVWANPEQFYLDGDLLPIDVAGCPPDAFSEDGQLWGNPLFRWDVMKKDQYQWWTKRLEKTAKLFDVIRIDHFRGFDSYYAIPYGDDTARNGEWRQGPGIELFQVIEKKLGRLDIIAEDLGFLTDSVRKMLSDSGYPGMKLIQFAFDTREDGDYLPHNYTRNSVVYAGTHDNDTIIGWMKTAPKASVAFAKEYLQLNRREGYHWGVMRSVWSSVSDLAVVTMQDLLGLASSARMNTPSTLGENWMWRMKPDAIDTKLVKKVRKQVELYGRLPKEPEA